MQRMLGRTWWIALLAFMLVWTSPIETNARSFTDVAPQYEKSVQYMTDLGVNGYSATEFGIHRTISRGDAAVYIARALNLWNEQAKDAGFRDIPKHRKDVQIAVNSLFEKGVMNGVSKTNFGYSANMTRGQLALLVSRPNAYHLSGDGSKLKFTDVPAGYDRAVAGLVEQKIVNGTSPTTFGTMHSMKRGDFATILYRLNEWKKEQGPSTEPEQPEVPTEPETPEEPGEGTEGEPGEGGEETPGEDGDEEEPSEQPEEPETPETPDEPEEEPGIDEEVDPEDEGNIDVEEATSVLILRETPASIVVEGKPFTVMKLQPNASYPFTKVDDYYYYIPFGNGEVRISKKDASPNKRVALDDVKKSRKTVLTKQGALLYHQANTASSVMAKLSPEVRLVVLGEGRDFYEVQIGSRQAFVLKHHTTWDSGVPVLMYHHIVENRATTVHKNNNMVIDYKDFDRQINYLIHNHWTPISFDTFREWKEMKRDLPKRVVVLTFDDGLLSLTKYAYPVLKRYNMPATAFVITGKIRQQAEPWDTNSLQNVGLKEIRETKDLINYQHHSHYFHTFDKNQPGVGKMITHSYEESVADLTAGKKQLAKAFDGDMARIVAFAYPFGQYNDKAIRAAKAVGIEYAFTTKPGTVQLSDDPMTMQRQGVGPRHTLTDFANKLNGTYRE